MQRLGVQSLVMQMNGQLKRGKTYRICCEDDGRLCQCKGHSGQGWMSDEDLRGVEYDD